MLVSNTDAHHVRLSYRKVNVLLLIHILWNYDSRFFWGGGVEYPWTLVMERELPLPLKARTFVYWLSKTLQEG